MLIRTHLSFSLLFIILFIPYVNEKVIFVLVVLAATYIPDIDSRYSKLGRRLLFRPLQWFVKHRGLLHSITFLIPLTLVLYSYSLVISFSFFVGYFMHIFLDCLTVRGIRLFYPFKFKIAGFVKTGGRVEIFIWVLLSLIDLLLIFSLGGNF